jgi:hypothetical protein
MRFPLQKSLTRFFIKTQPLKGLGGIISTIASLYLSAVPFVLYVCLSWRLDARIAFKSQRARASLSWPLLTSLRIYVFAQGRWGYSARNGARLQRQLLRPRARLRPSVPSEVNSNKRLTEYLQEQENLRRGGEGVMGWPQSFVVGN